MKIHHRTKQSNRPSWACLHSLEISAKKSESLSGEQMTTCSHLLFSFRKRDTQLDSNKCSQCKSLSLRSWASSLEVRGKPTTLEGGFMVILCSCSPPQFWPRSPDKEKLMGGRSSENHDEMMTEVGSVTESNRDICFMQPRCHPDLKIAFQYLLQIFLLLEVTVVQVGVPPLLTHCAANFHVEHVFQTSDNLHHSFVYLPFFEQK